MHWVLQNNIFNESKYDELIQVLERFNIPHSCHKVIPFIGEIEPPYSGDTSNVICIGSYSMRHLAAKNAWSPGVFDLFSKNFKLQLHEWGENMLNYDSKVVEFQHVEFVDDYHFIRPIDDSKAFAGKVFDRYEFNEWRERVRNLETNGATLELETLVQVCSLKVIYKEIRYWIVKGQIVTSSVYKVGQRVHYYENIDEQADQFVKLMVSLWEPDDAFVIDVCETPDGYKVVEVNTINSSGLYAADVQKLVMALEDNFSE